MGRNKLQKYAENAENELIFEPGKPLFETIKGKWKTEFFKNKKPIVIEIGCGYGEYTIGLAQNFSDKNFIGVDLKGSRLWMGGKNAKELGLDNVAFIRTRVEMLDTFFETNEVDEIWITFPDPRPKDRDIKRRLTSPRFLELYKKVLKSDGIVHLKTDSRPLFDYTLEVLEESKIDPIVKTFDLYKSDLLLEHFGIQTRYEKKFMAEGFTINYLRFKFD